MIDRDLVKHMAEISKLSFSDEEIGTFTEKFASVVKLAEQLNELDVDSVEATYGVNAHTQKFREDEVEEGLSQEEVLQNAPEEQYGYFKILKIVE